MEITNNSRIQQLSNSRFLLGLERICLFAAMVLLVVWPLKDTIAARNAALVVGCFASLVWVVIARPRVNLQTFIPALLLLAVPAWLWIHYFFLPTDVVAQLYDLKGTWLRVILAVIMASGLGLIISRQPKMMIWIWAAMAILAIITFADFLLEVKNAHQWVLNDFRFPFKYKSAVVYFLMWPCLLAYAILHFCFAAESIFLLNRKRQILFGFLGMGLVLICWIDFIAAHALNGILIAGICGVILLAIYVKHFFTSRNTKAIVHWLLLGGLSLVLLIALTAFWKYDQRYEHKLSNLFGDIQIASKIDQHPHWRRDPAFQGSITPADGSGRPVNVSTYERTAWFIKGIILLQDHPFGAGFSHLAFRYFMHQENPTLGLYKTHSGWLDYALGVGLPGLMLTWLAMGIAFYRSYGFANQAENSSWNGFGGMWIMGGIWLLWWPTEVSEREFIEYLFFMLSLVPTLALINPKKNV